MNNLPSKKLESKYPQETIYKIGILLNGVFKMYNIHDFIYLEGKRNYTKVVTANESIIVTKTLNTIHLRLPSNFIRIHKSYVININNCSHIDFKQRHVVTTYNEFLPISIRLRKNLDKYIF